MLSGKRNVHLAVEEPVQPRLICPWITVLRQAKKLQFVTALGLSVHS